MVAWEEPDTTVTNVYVKRWTGTAFVSVGGPIQEQLGTTNATVSRVVVDPKTNFPIVAWLEGDGSSSEVFVKRWDGSNWGPTETIKPTINNGVLSFQPFMTIGKTKTPVLSFIEQDPTGTTFSVYVQQMNR